MNADTTSARATKQRPLHLLAGALLALILASPAMAADLDVLRGSDVVLPPTVPVGPATFPRWSGFYVGGQGSFNGINADFSGATQPLLSFSLRNTTLEEVVAPSQWQVLGRGSNTAFGYGAFAGYNTQWQDLIIGVEANYTRTSITASASTTPISRLTSAGGTPYSVTETGTGTLSLTDIASLRARAGWILGDVVPYGFVGFAVGHGSYNITSMVSGQENPSTPPVVPCNLTLSPSCVDYAFSNNAGQSNALLYGFSVGGGFDWALTQNFFLRGEIEFIQFVPLANISMSIIDARVGGGFKF